MENKFINKTVYDKSRTVYDESQPKHIKFNAGKTYDLLEASLLDPATLTEDQKKGVMAFMDKKQQTLNLAMQRKRQYRDLVKKGRVW